MRYRINKNILKATLLILTFVVAPLVKAQTPDFTGIKILVNPGHGGHDSDDRGMPNGFWESESNLTKGIEIRDILEDRGAEVFMSRITNFTEDDLPLSQIAAMANENEVDLMLSIHSNAGNQSINYPMPIFNGHTNTPSIPEAKEFAELIYIHQWSNEATFWTGTGPGAIGDLTLNPTWNYGYGVLYPLTVPGIISEGSFHDYAPEVGRLLSLDYRRQEAWNMYYAMVDYFEIDEQEEFGHITGIVRDSLLEKDYYTIANSPDKYEVVKVAKVELIETGEIYEVGDTTKAQWFFLDDPDKEVNFNAGFYYFDSLPEGEYTLVFSGDRYFNDTVMVSVTPHSFSYFNQWMVADTTIAPLLVASNPTDGDTINCFDPLQFTFDMQMDSISFAGAFQVSPTIEGSFTWDEKYLNVAFQPNLPYETNKSYDVLIDTTAQQQWGVGLENELQLSFHTGNRNRYQVEFTYPASEQADVSPLLQFRVVFDAPIKNTSLIDAVAIIAEDGSVIGTKSAYIYTIDGKGHYYFSADEDLAFNTNYTLRLDGSIQDEIGIPLVDAVEIPFTTMEELGALEGVASFDALDPWSMDYTNSSGIDATSFIYRWGSNKVEGSASMLVRYNFLENSDGKVVVNTSQPYELNPLAEKVGIWIWGELSYNDIYLVFDDDYTQLLTTIDFAGWNYIELPLSSQMTNVNAIHINQSENGNLGGDILFDYLSQPEYVTVNEWSELNIRLYPNPLLGDKIYVNGIADSENAEYKILNTLGQVLQAGKVTGNSIDLTENTLESKILIVHITLGFNSSRSNFLLINEQ